MVIPTRDSEPRLAGSPDLGSALDIESPAFDRPLRIGVLLDSLTALCAGMLNMSFTSDA